MIASARRITESLPTAPIQRHNLLMKAVLKALLRFLGYCCLASVFAGIYFKGFSSATLVVLFFGLVFLIIGW